MAWISALYAYSWIYLFQLASLFLSVMGDCFFPSLLYCSHQNIKLYNGSQLKKEPLLTPQSSLPSKFSTCLLPFTDIHRHFLKNVFQDTQTHIHLFIIALYCLTHFFSKYLFQIYMIISESNQSNTCHLNIFKYFLKLIYLF